MSRTFQNHIEKYSDLVIRVGNNLQPGQRLLILGPWLMRGVPPELAPFVREVVRAAYRAGAKFVDVLWSDPEVDRIRIDMAPDGSFEEYPDWFVAALHEYLDRGDPTLIIYAEDPRILAGADSEKISTAMQTAYGKLNSPLEYITSNAVNWSVVCASFQGWADAVFPDLAEGERIDRLWEELFEICHIHDPDPISVWERRLKELGLRCRHLNGRRYSSLIYRGPGTELTVGLPDDHLWLGGKTESKAGVAFTPNVPTEEVFTLPHRDRVDGVVRATKPLVHAGNLIDGFSFEFEAGRVVAFQAQEGEQILASLLETDESARFLGEVALVANSSAISQSGLLFYNTLFDENAACHLALGRAYKFTLDGGVDLSNEEFIAQGGNHSQIHVDFMIGSDQIDIDGVTGGGDREAILRAGEWAFDAD